ncbi:nickel-dependent hydrogenase large subunit [Candidatus Calescamantes bacterium]|nr:nickel-dependent hydrogenase large subunit [Candidatus Calescamantes bacterium]
MQKIVIDPVTRIEGHLAVEVLLEGGKVAEAKSSGTLFRGFEIILKDRDPKDATQITQRICGVCPAIHAYTSALCLDDAFGIADTIPRNAQIIRNLILSSNFLQSHILHFYHLAIPDYVDLSKAIGKISPFFPSYQGDYRLSDETNATLASHYLQALEIRRICHEMLAIFGGKMPHNVGIVAGGVTLIPTVDRINNFKGRLKEIQSFIENVMLPDVLTISRAYQDYFEIGRGCRNFLSYGGFVLDEGRFFKAGIVNKNMGLEELVPNNITEHVKYSWYANCESGKTPFLEETIPAPEKEGGYSFIKSPRYKGEVYEVGPLARLMVNYLAGEERVRRNIEPVLKELSLRIENLPSVMGRHLARSLECKLLAEAMNTWVEELAPGDPIYTEADMLEEGEGYGLAEAPRGSCGHWIRIKERKIARYQVVTPTAWNASPRDDKGQPGPMEQALLGTEVKDEKNPFEVVRIVRAFDPCLACAVHLIDGRGKDLGRYRIV